MIYNSQAPQSSLPSFFCPAEGFKSKVNTFSSCSRSYISTMETPSNGHVKTSPNPSIPDEIFSASASPSLFGETLVSLPPSSSPRRSPISAQRLKNFFHDLQRDSRHALINRKAKIVQFWGGRRWRRSSAEEAEPFAEMEERELSSYGATGEEEWSAKRRKNSAGRKSTCKGQKRRRHPAEQRCWSVMCMFSFCFYKWSSIHPQ